MKRALGPALLLGLASCTGTSGGELHEFDAYAAGPADAVAGAPYAFDTGRGFHVTLDEARLHVGALYLNQARQTSVGADTSCTLPGIYSAEVTSGLDVDVLTPELQRFPERGLGTSDRAQTAEVWLMGGAVDAERDDTEILSLAGSVDRGGTAEAFSAKITIGANRRVVPSNPALPGAKPLCKQRVVSPIPVDLVPSAGAALVLRVDPRGFFANVDFDALPGSAPLSFADDSSDPASANLYSGLRASVGTYDLEWIRVSP